MFSDLNALLANHQKISLEVTKKGDQLSVLVHPILDAPIDEQDSDPVKAYKLALATPLAITATPEELDSQFSSVISTYAQTHQTIKEGLSEALASVEAALSQANKTQSASSSIKVKSDSKQASVPAQESGDFIPVSTDSLFD